MSAVDANVGEYTVRKGTPQLDSSDLPRGRNCAYEEDNRTEWFNQNEQGRGKIRS